MSNTKPLILSVCGTNGLAFSRAIDCTTSASRSVNASVAQGGRIPVSRSICALRPSSVNVIMPQSVWWMRMISRGAEQPLADHQRADHVVGDDSAGVADDVRVADGQAERAMHVEP